MPEEGISFLPHESILTYEEILQIIRLAVQKGIRKVRLTGGEPLVRKGFTGFLKRLQQTAGLDEITVTTNGVLLKKLAAEIKASGVNRINISLDTLRQDRFFRITGRDYFTKVWEGIQAAEQCGFYPIKLNVVVVRGLNDDEIIDFARLTLEKPYHIRFIEHMPIGGHNSWSSDKFVSSDETFQKIRSLGVLHPILKRNSLDGPAQRYILEGAVGEIGLISALSNHFCNICNRLRLTAEGHIRSCLFSDEELDIKTPLRDGARDKHLLELIDTAIKQKPEGHGHIDLAPRSCVRHMSSIGG